MRRQHAFRPNLADHELEGRLVLSTVPTTGITPPHNQDILSGVADRPGGGARLDVHDQLVAQFRRDFANFSDDYVSAATSILFVGGTSATATTLASNRAAFDAQVATLVENLTSQITTALEQSPLAQATLIPAIEDGLSGSGENSLLSRLAALTTPTDLNGTTAQQFGMESGALLNAVFQRMIARLDYFTAYPRLDFINGGFSTQIPGGTGGGTSGGSGGGTTSGGGTSGGTTSGGTGTGNVSGPVGGGGSGPGFLVGFPQNFNLEPGFNFAPSIQGVPIPTGIFGGIIRPRFAGNSPLQNPSNTFQSGILTGLNFAGSPAQSGLGLGSNVGLGFNSGTGLGTI